jgi:hypothetical protein
MNARLEVDAGQLGRFFGLLFRYADEGSYVSFRCFFDDRDGVDKIRASRLNGSPKYTVQEAVAIAGYAANHPHNRLCFAPPVATFTNAKLATERDLANGVALSVELDARPTKSRQLLEALLSPATVVVASGGEWSDPETGEVERKLHLHWRLADPTRTAEDHARLKRARYLAQRLAGADATTIPLVHPLRWPGSWHRKAEPRLCEILHDVPTAELDLDDALGQLEEAAAAKGIGGGQANGQDYGQSSDRGMTELVRRILTGEEYHACLRDLSFRHLKDGMAAARVVLTLRGLMDASTAPHDERWEHRRSQIPMLVDTAVRKLAEQAAEADPHWEKSEKSEKSHERPEALATEAFHGIAGEVVRAMEPHTEADPASILIQFLSAFGAACGRSAYVQVEGDRHPAQLWAVLVGETAKGRKGTSWGRIRQLFELACPEFARDRVVSGLSSGEGVIWAVRDPIKKIVEDKKTGELGEEIIDFGVDDKRLFVLESEFASPLRHMERSGNTLSSTLRCFWDNGDVAALTKNSPARTTGSLVSILGHVTAEELRRYLTRTEMANGLANRFMFLCTRRSKKLPFGGGDIDLEPLAARVTDCLCRARARGEHRVHWADGAKEIWREVYDDLSEGRPGMVGAVTSRAEAQTLRLALTYALLDGSAFIEAEHLRAALVVWRFCDQSCAYLFGTSLGNPVADEIRRALEASPAGLTRNDIMNMFRRHRASEEIRQALDQLAERGLARSETRSTGGRPGERWYAP